MSNISRDRAIGIRMVSQRVRTKFCTLRSLTHLPSFNYVLHGLKLQLRERVKHLLCRTSSRTPPGKHCDRFSGGLSTNCHRSSIHFYSSLPLLIRRRFTGDPATTRAWCRRRGPNSKPFDNFLSSLWRGGSNRRPSEGPFINKFLFKTPFSTCCLFHSFF